MNRVQYHLVATACAAFLGAGCGLADEDAGEAEGQAGAATAAARPVTLTWSFDSSAQGWSGGFADYPAGSESFYELEAGQAPLPASLGGGGGFRLSGNNHSDDLWMFAARSLGRAQGIAPRTRYDVRLTVRFASNAPSGCIGIGGAPGESVYLKGHVTNERPRAVPGADGDLAFSVDKGNQSQIGTQALDFGTMANGDPCEPDAPYRLVERTAASATPVRSTAAGQLWVYFGSDSGFEGTTTFFIDHVRLTLTPR